MTQDEIIEMARDSGMELYGLGKDRARFVHHLIAFAKLVAAKEREACKTLAKEYAAEYKEGGRLYPMLSRSITKTAATACDHIVYIIGKRGEA
jgi:hypothetical protein